LTQYFPFILKDYQGTEAGQTLSNAATTWRFPYWDWALNPSIPDEIANPSVNILMPNGEMSAVQNPLHHYEFQTSVGILFSGYRYFSQWPTTLRQPDSLASNASSQPAVVNQQIQSDIDWKAKVLDLFPTTLPQPDPWGQISNQTWNTVHHHQGHLTSIEEIHGRIHVDVGGSGHMGVVPFSAFDPIFWLHHCMIDRLTALWQAVFPGVYVSPGPNGGTSK
jgi:tyrosinase